MSVMKREFLLIFVEKSEIKECHPYNDKYRHWEIVTGGRPFLPGRRVLLLGGRSLRP